jgi:hypothetical protein
MKPAYPYDKQTETIHLPDEIQAEVKALWQAGHNSTALKRVMKLTGAGLAISKRYLDDLPGRQSMREPRPNPYTEPVSKLLGLGRPEGDAWPDYLALRLTPVDIPELIRLVEDHELRITEPPDDLGDDEDLPEWYAQIHAWRALGQLKAEAAIPAMLGILWQIDEEDDDWLGEDAKEVFALIGPAAIQPLGEYLADETKGLYARTAASGSLQKIAQAHPEARSQCINHLISVLEKYQENDEGLNGFIIADLVDLKDTEHLNLIERAFAEDRVDEMILGDFEDVEIELGLREKRSHPRTPFLPPFGRTISQEPMFFAVEKSPKEKRKEKDKRKQEKKSRKKNRKRK